MDQEKIYNEAFVGDLFDRMSATYGVVNYLSSFGFTERWRRQCIGEIHWGTGSRVVYDLMSGMGECWGIILQQGCKNLHITGVDISTEMNKMATNRLQKHPDWPIAIKQDNILQNSIESDTADVLVSSFGLKTFSKEQLERLANEVASAASGEYSVN